MKFDEYELDKRKKVIDRMNEGRTQAGKAPLIPRQEHLVREFTDDEGNVAPENMPLLRDLLQSNSA